MGRLISALERRGYDTEEQAEEQAEEHEKFYGGYFAKRCAGTVRFGNLQLAALIILSIMAYPAACIKGLNRWG